MTRETRVGTVVAGSFLCLLSIVVASKWRDRDVSREPEEQGAEPGQVAENGKARQPTAPPVVEQAVFNNTQTVETPTAAAAAPLPQVPEVFPVAQAPLPVAPRVNDPEQARTVQQLQQAKEAAAQTFPALPGFGPEAAKDAVAAQPLPTAPGAVEMKLPAATPTPEQSFFPVDVGKKDEKKESSPPPPTPAGAAALEPPAAASPLPNPAAALAGPPPLAAEPPLPVPVEKKEAPGFVPPPLPVEQPLPAAAEKKEAAPSGPPPLPAPAVPQPQERAVPPPMEQKLPPLPSAPMAREVLPPVVTAPMPLVPKNDPPPAQRDTPPPIGARLTDLPAPSAPITPAPVEPARTPGGRLPEVKTYATQVRAEVCQPSDSSFTALSQRLYGSDRYAAALQAFNSEHLQADPAVKLDPPRLQAGTRVFAPPLTLLESTYGDLVRKSAASASGAGALPPVRISTPQPLGQGNPNVAAAQVGPPPTADATKRYLVPAEGRMMLQIARDTLGDASRWGEIYRLNPNLMPQYPIPGGTELRLPTTARVP